MAVHDPVALPAARSILSGATAVEDPFDAAEGAHAVVIATDWDDYRTADLERLKAVMAEPVIVDGRDVLDPGAVTAAGFIYASVGRPTLYPRKPGGSTHSSPGGATGEPASEPTRSSP